MSIRPTILLLDDEVDRRAATTRIAHDVADVVVAASWAEARERVHRDDPALVVLDVGFRGTGDGDRDDDGADALAFCREIKRMAFGSPVHVMLVSDAGDRESRVAGYEAGADDFLVRPFDRRELVARLAVHLRHRAALDAVAAHREATATAAGRLTDIVEEQARGIIVARTMTARALATLAENRDADTGEHLDRMRDYAVAVAEELRRDPRFEGRIDGRFVEQLHHAAPLHDIGKVAIPDAILQKPARLTGEEFEVMKSHAEAGSRVLEAIHSLECDGGIGDEASFMPMAIQIARSHHERWDGTGYPDGTAGEAIPLAARITAVADVLDALASARVYKDPMPFEEAAAIVIDGRGTHFDPAILDAFERARPRLRAIRDRFRGRATREGVFPHPATRAA